ncbi:hypothetical protein ACFL1I_04030 [Candidatus Omnitrophota bacterium]
MNNSEKKRVPFLKVVYSALRHRFLVFCRPRYVISSLFKRKGECRGCGMCCALNTPWCRQIKDNHCEIYQRQPFFCKIFPIDKKDQELSNAKDECGYFWEKEKQDGQ